VPRISIGDCALYYEAHGSGEPWREYKLHTPILRRTGMLKK